MREEAEPSERRYPIDHCFSKTTHSYNTLKSVVNLASPFAHAKIASSKLVYVVFHLVILRVFFFFEGFFFLREVVCCINWIIKFCAYGAKL